MLVLWVFISQCVLSWTKEHDNKLDRYLIACHTTDFECFKRQYKSLRDNILLGNEKFSIPRYEHFTFEYGKFTCVKLAGIEDSELVGISMEHQPRKFTMSLMLPLRIQQVKQSTRRCVKPDKEFTKLRSQTDSMMRFTGNATIDVSYPFKLRKRKGEIFMKLDEEDLDVILDIPDLSHFDMNSEVESKLYEWSEWAYDVVQHVDAAQRFALPYTSQMRIMMENVPITKLLLLYPEEEYVDVQFHYNNKWKSE